jgi:hypothetical protein
MTLNTYTDGWNDGYRHSKDDLFEKIQEQIDIAWANEDDDVAQAYETLLEFLQEDN